MGLMQSGSNFTDRIVKYVAKRAERKTKPASPPMGHVIPQVLYCLQKGTFLSLFSVNYHVALHVCFSSKHQLRMPNVGLIACVTREN